MKSILLISAIILLAFSPFAQINCLNTPEFPFETQDNNYYSWSSGLYMPSQLGGSQNLTSISFRLDNVGASGTYTYSQVHVWMRNTSVTDFTTQSSHPGYTGFTEVYNGNFTFNGTGIKTFNFNSAPSFAYNGTDNLEVMFEFRGGNDNTWYEPWFDRNDARTDGVKPGKVGQGSNWTNAKASSSLRSFNLQIYNVMGCSIYPLGVSFTGSTLNCNDDILNLSWNVASEENNDYYTIESSKDGKSWDIQKIVKGAGTIASSVNYSAELNNRNSEIVYCRLSQTDFDGKMTQLVTHAIQCNQNKVNVSPNPFNGVLAIYSDVEVKQLALTNSLGENISIHPTTYENRLEINTERLISGIYFLAVTTQLGTKVHRLVKI